MIRTWLAGATVAASVLLAGDADAQARYLAPRQNGFHLAASLIELDRADGWTADAGFTLHGWLDLAVGHGSRSYDTDYSGHAVPGMSAEGLRVQAAVTLLRPTPTSAVGVELAGRYAEATYSGERLEIYQYEASETFLSLGGVVYLRLPGVSSLEVLPAVGFYRGEEDRDVDSVEFGRSTTTTAGVLVTAELGFLIASRIAFVPGFAHFDGEDTWSLTLRLLLPIGG